MPKKKQNTSAIKEQKDYEIFLQEILEKIRSSQYQALLAANRAMLSLYWDIGKTIVEKQQKLGWGKSVVQILAQDLQEKFPGIRGFSVQNLWLMRQFFKFYATSKRLEPLIKDIAWSHHLAIMTKCKDELECEFYIRMTRKYGWTRNVLVHQIENKTYEKTLISQNNFDTKLPEAIRNQAKLAVKDEYTYDFLDLGDKYCERTLEKALIANVESFLREMGDMFTFVGSQYRLEIGNKEYFIDILLYNRRLRSLIALELKIGAFMPEYIGKIQFYLAVLDDKVRLPDESPSIGIILCKTKNKTIVEYALRNSKNPIGVATYTFTPTLPRELEAELPRPEQVAKLLEGIDGEKAHILPEQRHLSNSKKDAQSFEYKKKVINKIQKKVVQYLKKNETINNQEYQQIAKVKKRQASKELKILVDEGILQKMGKRGRGTYYVLSK